MTYAQRKECEDIIEVATVAAGATGFLPIPGSDAGPLAAIQVTMILALSDVFDVMFTKNCAINLAKNAIAENIGKYTVAQFLGWIPFGGNAIKGTVAATITNKLGWNVARDFDYQYKRQFLA